MFDSMTLFGLGFRDVIVGEVTPVLLTASKSQSLNGQQPRPLDGRGLNVLQTKASPLILQLLNTHNQNTDKRSHMDKRAIIF